MNISWPLFLEELSSLKWQLFKPSRLFHYLKQCLFKRSSGLLFYTMRGTMVGVWEVCRSFHNHPSWHFILTTWFPGDHDNIPLSDMWMYYFFSLPLFFTASVHERDIIKVWDVICKELDPSLFFHVSIRNSILSATESGLKMNRHTVAICGLSVMSIIPLFSNWSVCY